MRRWATVICDASYYRPRNGKKIGVGGWAAWIRVDGLAEALKYHGELKVPVPGSTQAEVRAALNGVWLARRAGAEGVLIRSDCMSVIDLINGKGKSGSPVYEEWRQAFLREDMSGLDVRGVHVKGHGLIKCRATWVNDWADRMAKYEQRKARKRIGL